MKTPHSASISLTISDVAFGGNGVARHEGKVVFVPFTIPGETVTARIVRQKKSFAEAELISVDEASPDRVEPRCPYFTRCGGCSYQHISYERQLAIKAGQVEQTLRRVGRLAEVPMQPTIGSPKDYEYRNRIRVHVAGGVAGFYAHGAHALIDVEQCPISAPEVNRALRNLRNSPIHDGDYSLRAKGGGPFFEQTNPAVAGLLVDLVERTVKRNQALLLDAYCGAGLFAKRLAPHFEKVIGIEENEHALELARRGSAPHETYLSGDVAEHLGDILQAHDATRTSVVLDPPATGISTRVADLLLGGSPEEIVYVSCNPATMARDLAILCGRYALKAVTPVDMFPQTAEIEVVAHLAAR
ncbi:MAG TPA: class I SAM-dependent RNA methyltransferase [Chthoniobacteraceae bacterium]|jgi:tRNA/tmRNA/rRNA uracil-C5-methylase (TrmA/RlmC/RlmD family)